MEKQEKDRLSVRAGVSCKVIEFQGEQRPDQPAGHYFPYDSITAHASWPSKLEPMANYRTKRTLENDDVPTLPSPNLSFYVPVDGLPRPGVAHP